MFKIKNEFDRICVLADTANQKLRSKRFLPMSNTNRKYASYGVYDNVTKRYVLFDTIMFAGHYNYNKNRKPPEFDEMEQLIRQATQ